MTQTITWEWGGVVALYLFIACYALWTWWQFRKDFKPEHE